MKAADGDRIIIRGTTVNSADKHGTILQVRGDDGAPPYSIRYDDGHESLVYPGTDFILEKDSPVP